MVNFLRDVMIVVAILATFIALAFYPAQEPGPAMAKHDIPIGVPAVPVGAGSANVETVKTHFDQRAPQ